MDLAAWDAFVDGSPQGTMFCRSWWLRAALGQFFEITTLQKGDALQAGLVLPFVRIGSQKHYVRPSMSTSQGVLLTPHEPNRSNEKNLSQEMSLLSQLVDSIPQHQGFRISLHPSLQNWLPFYWAGFQQTTAYTYVLEGIQDLDALQAGMDHSKRKNLKRAKGLVEIHDDLSATAFYQHHQSTLRKEGKIISYKQEYLERIVSAAKENAGVEILTAVDTKGAVHSAIVVLYDVTSAYYVASSIDPEYRNSGSVTLLLVEAMRRASVVTNRFDFEGSMIQGVEQSFRRFGARQIPYQVIYKDRGIKQLAWTALGRVARRFGIKE